MIATVSGNTETKPNKDNKISDGNKTNLYDIPEWVKDVDDLSEWLDLRFDEGNCLKALFGIAMARKGSARHQGTTLCRDANKLGHYANKVKLRVNKVDNEN